MTARQKQLLDFIRSYFAANDCAPTYAQMAAALNHKARSNTHAMAVHLVLQGHLAKCPITGGIELPYISALTSFSSADLIAELHRRDTGA